ncbi:MAG: KH domain-containing protein [Candidatus Hadarchaeota archaeon]
MYIRIPKERIGAAIGPDGSVKREIEKRTGSKITFDSETGEAKIEAAADPLGALKASDVLKAISRGFSPARAFKLFEEDQFMDVLDIRDYVGGSEKTLKRMRGRLIGEEGKARGAMERETGTHISVYGKTVAVIGTAEQISVAREAIEMLLKGSEHTTVYRFLQRKKKMRSYGPRR